MRHPVCGQLTLQEAPISSIADLSGRAADAAAAQVRALSLVPQTAPEAAPAPRRLAQVEAAFGVFDDHLESAAAIAAASDRARTLCEAGGDGVEAETSAALAFAAEALTGVMLRARVVDRDSPQRPSRTSRSSSTSRATPSL